MKLNYFMLIILINLILYGCICNSKEININAISNNVVIIFKDAPLQTSGLYNCKSSKTSDPYECINYLDTNLAICNFQPRSIGMDTIILPALNGYVNVRHTYKVFEQIDYLFTAGDTILFSYDSLERPYAKSLTNDNYTSYYNIMANIPNNIINKSGYSNWATMRADPYNMAFKYMRYNGYEKFPSIKTKYEELYIDLDSVEQAYYKCMDLFKLDMKTKLKGSKINNKQFSHIISQIENNNKWVIFFYNWRHGIKDTLVKAPFIAYNDSLIYNLSYHYNIFSAADKQSFDKSGMFQVQGFDKIMEQNIPPITKKVMLRHLISQMDEYNTSQYINKYIVETGDSLYYNKLDFGSLTNISHANIMENGYSNDFILKTINGDVLNYGELIQRNKGKVIYVDFWASWCAPCKGEMPSSIKLHNEYIDKDVIFIYLAYNDKQAVWEAAMKECGISQFKENYIIANSQSAEFVKEIKLSTIPRFMLYNKEGKLIDIDAPRPSSKEIKGAIDALLKGK